MEHDRSVVARLSSAFMADGRCKFVVSICNPKARRNEVNLMSFEPSGVIHTVAKPFQMHDQDLGRKTHDALHLSLDERISAISFKEKLISSQNIGPVCSEGVTLQINRNAGCVVNRIRSLSVMTKDRLSHLHVEKLCDVAERSNVLALNRLPGFFCILVGGLQDSGQCFSKDRAQLKRVAIGSQ